ncbi:hypothetical protein K2O51_30835 (plasmid) [Cupriavidus pinatubonensis]|uniref:hypothetical protein n=1 Tax=Cupriavidus pinatubonensis TaxID=248026 RepID=UPI001C72B74A|nr:hypothetical protein [Cupriavidus pinatubonensis]QYY33646.1 hypothetical protein K2O51_30835 [Cupriavidus pinatubonensis]
MKTLVEIAQADRYELDTDDLAIRNAMADLAAWLRQKFEYLTTAAPHGTILAVSPELKEALLALEHGGEMGQAAVAAVPTVTAD